MALALGALGVFSGMSYVVAERTREFGIRLALGASRREILHVVFKPGLITVAIGTAVSVTGTLAVTRITFGRMADLSMTDLVLWASVSAILATVAVGASMISARRATRVEPVVAQIGAKMVADLVELKGWCAYFQGRTRPCVT